MKTLKKLLLLAAAAALSGCVYDAYPPHMPHHPGPGGSHNQSSHYYREGRDAGERDARRGLSQSPSRHWARVPGVYRSDFSRGYNLGYRENSGHRPGGEAVRYHQSGYDHGVRDRSRGLSHNPDRHSHRVPRQYIRDFRRGYDSGWNAGGRPGWPRR